MESGVLGRVLTLRARVAGEPLVGVTTFDGVNRQVAPAGNPAHESAIKPVKFPTGETVRDAEELVAPGATEIEAGERPVNVKSVT